MVHYYYLFNIYYIKKGPFNGPLYNIIIYIYNI